MYLVFTNLNVCTRRSVTSIRRHCRLWSIPFLAPRLITSRCGQPLHQHTAMSVRGCCGASPGRACDVPSVVWNATRSAKTSLMPTVCKVSLLKQVLKHLLLPCIYYVVYMYYIISYYKTLPDFSLLFSVRIIYCYYIPKSFYELKRLSKHQESHFFSPFFFLYF